MEPSIAARDANLRLGACAWVLASSFLAIAASLRSRSFQVPIWKLTDGTFDLLKFFTLASSFVMAIVAMIVVIAFQAHQTSTLLRIAESQNGALARSFGNTIWLSHSGYLQSVGQLDGDALRARPETAEIDQELRKITRGLPVLKVKIYNPQGLTIYSSEPSQMGESKSGNAGFLSSVSESRPVSKMSYRGQFSTFSGVVAGVDLAETYVPLLDAAGKTNIVFELYTDISDHLESMRRDTWPAAAMVLGAFVVIYLALLLVVRRADHTLRFQYEALTAANAELISARRLTDDLNADLKEKVDALQRSNQDLKDFAHVAAHDLQEPLRKIEAFGDRLSRRYGETLPTDGQMFIERMRDASSRMRRLITDLLTYARVERTDNSLEMVDLNEVVDGVLSDLQVRIEDAGAVVTVTDLPKVQASLGQMRQLLQNLIANALKFQKSGMAPKVDVSAKFETGADGVRWACITVSDNGIGFDNGERDQIFKLFQRLHGKSEYEGTGVGLATCRRIAEAHRGTIDANGRPGQGATFEVRIPVRQVTTMDARNS